jgi:hypothetical protein
MADNLVDAITSSPKFKISISDDTTYSLNEFQKQNLCHHSEYLRKLFLHTRRLNLQISGGDTKYKNFNSEDIELFFKIFEVRVGEWFHNDLDYDTLLKLCHVCRWLRCTAEALAESPSVQMLKDDLLTMTNWRTPGERYSHVLVISLILGWNKELKLSCNALIYRSITQNDGLIQQFPSIEGMETNLNEILLLIAISASR